MMVESLIADLLLIETREDYRELHRGEIRQIDLNDKCDLAYIRCCFKRYLKDNQSKYKGIRMIDNFNNGVRYNFTDLNTLEGLSKVITAISNWVNIYCKETNVKAMRLELY